MTSGTLLPAGGHHSPGVMQLVADHARIQEDGCFSTIVLKAVEKSLV